MPLLHMTLQDYLDEHGIMHFRAAELLSREVKGGPKIIEPPVGLWPHILQTLECADEIRDILGAPVRVVSGYRTEAYNRLVGGVPKSEHPEFRALDLRADDHDALVAAAKRVMDSAHARGIRTGLGIYPSFVHIDTGSRKAFLRRWPK